VFAGAGAPLGFNELLVMSLFMSSPVCSTKPLALLVWWAVVCTGSAYYKLFRGLNRGEGCPGRFHEKKDPRQLKKLSVATKIHTF
jgi:hypothetical protein